VQTVVIIELGMGSVSLGKSLYNLGIGSLIMAFLVSVAYPRILFGGGSSTNSVEVRAEDRERGSGGGSPLVRGSGGSCNLVQEISLHIVKFYSFLVL